MGTTPAIAEEHIPQAVQILDFVRAYEPPPFPGPIDSARAARGREIYQSQCAQCHGEYSPGIQSVRLVSFPNRHVTQAEMNTDSARWQPDSSLIPVLRKTEFGKHIDAASTGGYVATPLTAPSVARRRPVAVVESNSVAPASVALAASQASNSGRRAVAPL